MSASGWGSLIAVGGIAVGVVGYQIDTSVNYVKVDAMVQSVKIDCFIEAGKSKLVEKSSNEQAFVDCELAPMLAERFGYQKSAIQKRATVSYEFRSPVDKSWQTGEHTEKHPSKALQEAQRLKIYAHTTNPAKSRWAHSIITD